MRDLGALWKKYQADKAGRNIRWTYDKRIIVDGEIYNENEIIDFFKSGGLILNDFAVGTCVAMRFDALLRKKENTIIPPRAKVVFQMRIVDLTDSLELYEANLYRLYDSLGNAIYIPDDIRHTEWIDFGTYYIDKRETEKNLLRIECYDALIYANEEFFKVWHTINNYPMTASEMLEIIAELIHVGLDERNAIRGDRIVQYPNMLTIREILSFIASAHGGNFFITDDNKLRLVIPKNDMPLFKIKDGDLKRKSETNSRQFSRLFMTYNDNGDYFEAGEGDTSIEVLNLFATSKETAEYTLNVIKDYIYNPFTAQSVVLDPALELGDSGEINDVQVNLWTMSCQPRIYFDISAPTEGDSSREFDFDGTRTNALRRQMSDINNQFAEMSLTFDEFNVTLGQYSTIEQTLEQIDDAITSSEKKTSDAMADMRLSIENGFNVTLGRDYYSKAELTGGYVALTDSEGNIVLDSEGNKVMVLTDGLFNETEEKLRAEFNVGFDGLSASFSEDINTLETSINGSIKTVSDKQADFEAGLNGLTFALTKQSMEDIIENGVEFETDEYGNVIGDTILKTLQSATLNLAEKAFSVSLQDYYTKTDLMDDTLDEHGNPIGIIAKEQKRTADLEMTFDEFNVTLGRDYYSKAELTGGYVALTDSEGNAVLDSEGKRIMVLTDGLFNETEEKLRAEFNVGFDGLSYKLSKDYSTTEEINGVIAETSKTLKGELTMTTEKFSTFLSETIDGNESFSQLLQSVDGISTTVSSNTGDLSYLTLRTNSISATVSTNSSRITAVVDITDQILLRVADAEGNFSSLSQTVQGFLAWVENADGQFSSFEQTAEKINFMVSGEKQSEFELTENGIRLVSSAIDLTGIVTFNADGGFNLPENMTSINGSNITQINGSNITTGSIKAERIGAGILSAPIININQLRYFGNSTEYDENNAYPIITCEGASNYPTINIGKKMVDISTINMYGKTFNFNTSDWINLKTNHVLFESSWVSFQSDNLVLGKQGTKLGFFGTTAVSRQNAYDLQSLLSAMRAYGLIW